MIDPVLLLPPALVLASVTLPGYRYRRAGLAAVLLLQLTLASLELTGGIGPMAASLPASYQAISAALLAGGLLLIAATAVRAVVARPDARLIMALGGVLVVGVAVQLALILGPLLRGGGALLSIAALFGLAAAGATLVGLVRAQPVKSAFWRVERRIAPPRNPGPDAPVPTGRPAMLAVHLGGVLLALVAPNLLLLVLGVLLALVAGAIWEYQAGLGARWPVGAFIAGVALLIATVMLLQVAGDTPLALDRMTEGPFSEAFQLLLAPVLALAAWPLVRLWPLHGTRTGPAAALAGAAILVRLLSPILPDGVSHWQPVLYGLLAIGAGYGAVVRNDALLGSTIAALGLLSGQSEAGWGGIAVLTAAIALQSLARATRKFPPALIAGRIILIAASLAVIPMLLGGLQAEVAFTVAVMAGAITGLLAGEDRRRVDRGPSLV